MPDRSKGKFRTFLLMLLKRYLSAARGHQTRQKRGGGCEMVILDGAKLNALERVSNDALLIGAPLDEERLFEWNWAAAPGQPRDGKSAGRIFHRLESSCPRGIETFPDRWSWLAFSGRSGDTPGRSARDPAQPPFSPALTLSGVAPCRSFADGGARKGRRRRVALPLPGSDCQCLTEREELRF